jgi:AraC-like DNA-binding protein
MLRDGLSASEVAAQVGYESASHFSRDFKSHYGSPPAAYAREMRARLGA